MGGVKNSIPETDEEPDFDEDETDETDDFDEDEEADPEGG